MTSSDSIQAAIQHAHHHREETLEGFIKLLSFASISADPAYKRDIHACADWLVGQLQALGFENCRKIETDGHPVVYAEWLKAGPDKPTVLVYDHYDVQPVDPLHLWQSEPFAAEIRDGRLYARGAVDNKAGVWGNLKVFEALMAADGGLPLNVKVLFEGEEESGSPNMQPFVAAHKDLLTADVLLNCDGGFEPDNPSISYAGRGIISAEVKVTGPKADLHSGIFGGVVQNPLHVAGRIIGAFHDADGRVAIPGYHDAVKSVDEAERGRIHAGWNGDKLATDAGVPLTWGAGIAPDAERATIFPTLDVNGMTGGYQGPGTKTIIPAEASFKVTMRLVPDQDPAVIAQSFVKFVESFSTETVRVTAHIHEESWPFAMQTEGAYLEAVQAALEATIGRRAQLHRSGGSIPILGMFNRLVGVPMTGFGYGDGDGIHSPNEYVVVDSFFQALEAGIRLYHNLAATGKPG
jgi:acetylornithine deacetylase/succinyl-diaminopimelate desuccinylase-like protein